MDKKTILAALGACSAVLALAMLIAVLCKPTSSGGFKDPTWTLAVVAGAAVAIERVIEALWTVLGGVLGSYWPLNVVGAHARSLAASLDVVLQPLRTRAEDALKDIGEGADAAKRQLVNVNKSLTLLASRVDNLQRIPPDNQRLLLTVAAANQFIDEFQRAYAEKAPELARAIDAAKATASGVQDFVASFKDNPGRRLVSIFLGSIIGVVVAGFLGLDLFQAAMEDASSSTGQVILTGLLIGLGATPTHEVIRAVQEYKKSRKVVSVALPGQE